MKKEYFVNELKENDIKIKEKIKNSNLISVLRLLVFILLLVTFICAYKYNIVLLYILSLVLIVVFAFLIKKHSMIINKVKYYKSKDKVLKKYIARYDETWKSFEDTGEDFLNSNCIYSKDLDIFGKNSLYQYINVASTKFGRNKLNKYLTEEKHNINEIKLRQQAVKEMTNNIGFCLEFQSYLNLFTENKEKNYDENLEKLLLLVENEPIKITKFEKTISIILPIFTITSIILGILNLLPLYIISICVIIQLFFASIKYFKLRIILSPITSVREYIEKYNKLFHVLNKEKFLSEFLNKIKYECKDALKAMKKLDTIISMANIRDNALMYLILNMFFMWDYQCLNVFSKWSNLYKDKTRLWFESIGKVEAIMSLSVISQVKEITCMPNISYKDKPIIQAVNISHPLINEIKAVGNNVELKQGTYIITGSNMSGKTTFMRTIGINLVLAISGAQVCANSFTSSIFNIFTSMRLEDNIGEGISTFYAEINRIKEIIDSSTKPDNMIVLIDEIFKGTNYSDRIICAKKIIERLNKSNIIDIVTTHDFDLCDLENDSNIKAKNYHFTEYYENENIKFDYKIKDGRCTTTNAQALMKLAGIIK